MQNKNHNIAQNIKNLRKKHKLTQFKLGKKIGVTPVFISNIENENQTISLKCLVKICQAFELNVDQFINEVIEWTTL